MTKKSGFTLAEVLITLGIIGVVAAMTIPTLIANTNGTKFRSQFKKTLSTLNQAGLMAQAQYDLDYAGTNAVCKNGASDHPDSDFTFCALLNGTLTGQTYYAKTTDIKRSNNGAEAEYVVASEQVIKPATAKSYHAYTLADGSIVAFDANAKDCTLPIGTQLTSAIIGGTAGEGKANLSSCLGFIDVNGATLPNKEVTCTTGNKATTAVETPCTVKNDASHMTDIFPIVFHDATVEPASDAAKYILTSAK
jgi:prepilin-type N-terminal cleavage/methylation domain-containing protein